ncbi:MAG: hypothetical protein H0X02_10495, partial [Nitrosomonas sp.]|nr:hypothetical protein [Nitrosomonas sp.]
MISSFQVKQNYQINNKKGKAMKLFFWLLLVIALFGCEAITAANQGPYVDVKLIGVWKGEYTEQDGTIKRWTQTRNADGTYAIES